MGLREDHRAALDAAGKSLHDARALQEQHGLTAAWPADIQAQFDKHLADHAAHKTEAQRLWSQIESRENHAALERDFSTVRPGQQAPIASGPGTPEQMAAAAKHREVFTRYLRQGEKALTAEEVQRYWNGPREQHAMSSVVGELGGFLAPPDFRAQVVSDLPQFAVMRPLCRVEPTDAPVLELPSVQSRTGTGQDIYSSGYTGAWKSENYVTGGTAPPQQNNPKFGLERVPVHMWAPDAIELPYTLLADSKANIDAILAKVIAETWALDEDAAYTNGTGLGQPLGIMNTSGGIPEINSGHASTLTYDGLVDLFTGLPSQYRRNAKVMLNSSTYGAILKLKSTTNEPLFPVGAPVDKLWNKDFVFNEFMASVAANARPIIFGDFYHYGIADRQELRIQRLPDRFAPNIGILAMARVGGQVLRARAFRYQKIAA